ncbi:MAG: hypothetical protein AAGD09_20355, partial [Cyanobacteria bacterium P01_F01_bin.56]
GRSSIPRCRRPLKKGATQSLDGDAPFLRGLGDQSSVNKGEKLNLRCIKSYRTFKINVKN